MSRKFQAVYPKRAGETTANNQSESCDENDTTQAPAEKQSGIEGEIPKRFESIVWSGFGFIATTRAGCA
jgi:hypothetical protein